MKGLSKDSIALVIVCRTGCFSKYIITFVILPPFLFICRWIVQFCTIQRHIKRNGGSSSEHIRCKQHIGGGGMTYLKIAGKMEELF
jgi:hypothetical protein